MNHSLIKKILSKLACYASLSVFLVFPQVNPIFAAEEVIAISNQGFDAQSLLNNSYSLLYVEDWEQEGNGGTDTFNVGYGLVPQPTSGENVARLFSVKIDGEYASDVESSIVQYLFQPLDKYVANNTEYTLTFDVGNPAGGQDGGVVLTAYLVAGEEISAEQVGQFVWSQPLTSVPDGGFLTDRKTSLKVTRSSTTTNLPLNIVFVYENTLTDNTECMTSWTDYTNTQYCYQSIAYIDNVRLTAQEIKPTENGRKF